MRLILLVNDGIERDYKNDIRNVSGIIALNVNKSEMAEILSYDRKVNDIIFPFIITEFNGTLRDVESVVIENRETILSHLDRIVRKDESIAITGLRREERNVFKGDRISHDFNRIQLAKIVAERILNRGKFKVDLRNPDVKIAVIAYGDLLVLGWLLAEKLWKKRLYRKHVHKAALKPTIAAYIVEKGGLDIYDPMCGYGTIPFEALALKHQIPSILSLSKKEINKIIDVLDLDISLRLKERASGIIYCSDASKKTRLYVLENLEQWRTMILKKTGLSVEFNMEIGVKDVQFHKPFNAERIVTNPPYGIRMTRLSAIPRIYNALVRFAYDSGASRFDVITARYKLFESLIKGLWIPESKVDIMFGGLRTRAIFSHRNL